MLPLSDENMEQTSGYGLYIRSVGIRDLGPYTCQAYNGLGPADSSTLVLQVLGPLDRSSIAREDQGFLRFIVDAPTYYTPPAPAPAPPVIPGYNPAGGGSPTNPYDSYSTGVAPPPPQPQVPISKPRPPTGYIAVEVGMPRTRFPLNEQISIPCTVNSYSQPIVEWKHNGSPLRSSRRLQIIRENNTLTIFNSRSSDSGTYTCEADNGYNRDSASVSITVENISVQQECTDNPYFANCKLIVKAEYCTNKYYAKFCCRSCTLAGQLRGY